jgi:hypothetical protein
LYIVQKSGQKKLKNSGALQNSQWQNGQFPISIQKTQFSQRQHTQNQNSQWQNSQYTTTAFLDKLCSARNSSTKITLR